MGKNYQNIASFVEERDRLVSDADNGIYFVESMADKMEERIGQAMQKEATLKAKFEEIEQLNEDVKNLKAQLEQALTESKQKDEEINSLNERIDQLTNDTEGKDTQVSDLQQQIAQKDEEIQTLTNQLTEKNEEIENLSKKTAAQPASTETKTEEGQEEEQTAGPRNVTNKDMTLQEKAEALEKRRMQLLGVR